MFRQGFTSPALLKSVFAPVPYGAVTLFSAAFQLLPVNEKTALA